MNRIGFIILLGVFQLNCTSGPVGIDMEETEVQNEKTQAALPICTANNESTDCELLLSTIEYQLPNESCNVYDLLVEIDTEFYTPAGLGEGSTTRIDWEFYPNGNAGFWIAPIKEIIPVNSSGVIQMFGCFSYGEQETLKITRTIKDGFGNESNTLTLEIDNPVKGKTISNSSSNFLFQNSYSFITETN